MSHYAMTWEQAVIWLKGQGEHQDAVRACYFDDPISAAALRFVRSSEWRAVRRELPAPPGDALDLGAGRGISSFALACEGWRVTALEPDPSEVVGRGAISELVHTTHVLIESVEGAGETLPFPSERFDLVYCRAVLHHARDLEKLCEEVARVLRPNGLFVATREHVVSDERELAVFLKTHLLHHLYGGEYAYQLGQYVSAIKNAGLVLRAMYSPFSSDINLFPETTESIRLRIASKLKIVPVCVIPNVLLRVLDRVDRTPGRLFSFVARKPS